MNRDFRNYYCSTCKKINNETEWIKISRLKFGYHPKMKIVDLLIRYQDTTLCCPSCDRNVLLLKLREESAKRKIFKCYHCAGKFTQYELEEFNSKIMNPMSSKKLMLEVFNSSREFLCPCCDEVSTLDRWLIYAEKI